LNHIKLFESFIKNKGFKLFEELTNRESNTCEIIITGCTPLDSNVGHWLTHEHIIRVSGEKLPFFYTIPDFSTQDHDFEQGRNDYALDCLQKGEFEILADDNHIAHISEVEEVFDPKNIKEIAKTSDSLEEFAKLVYDELYDVVLGWFKNHEDEEESYEEDEEDEDDNWITPDNTGAIAEVMGSPKIVWY
jgi:hypothetical protein